MNIDPATILDWIQKTGTLGLALGAGWAGYKRLWVFGWVYDGIVADRDQWRALALRGTELGNRGVDLAKQALAPQQKD